MSRGRRSNASLALSLGALAAGMAMLAYASVPLYRLFCQTTGFGGTPQRADHAPATAGGRAVEVRFNADIAPGLPWRFTPGQRSMTLKVGENRLAYYTVKNLTNGSITGHATYNVLPDSAGAYFVKIECFCFKDQTLKAGQEVQMPVSFFIDPAITEDRALRGLKTITLSYTFFPSKSKQ